MKFAFEPIEAVQPGQLLHTRKVLVGFVPSDADEWDYSLPGAGTATLHLNLDGTVIKGAYLQGAQNVLAQRALAGMTTAEKAAMLSVAQSVVADPAYFKAYARA